MCAWPGLVESNWKNTSYSVYKKGSATLVSVLRLAAMKKLRSTTNSSSDVPFSAEQIHAFRLRRHHLLDQSGKDLVTICRDVCGVQAQIMSAAQLQLWARNHAITPAIVNDALLNSRTLVKTSLMRQTLHWFPQMSSRSTLPHKRRGGSEQSLRAWPNSRSRVKKLRR